MTCFKIVCHVSNNNKKSEKRLYSPFPRPRQVHVYNYIFTDYLLTFHRSMPEFTTLTLALNFNK